MWCGFKGLKNGPSPPFEGGDETRSTYDKVFQKVWGASGKCPNYMLFHNLCNDPNKYLTCQYESIRVPEDS